MDENGIEMVRGRVNNIKRIILKYVCFIFNKLYKTIGPFFVHLSITYINFVNTFFFLNHCGMQYATSCLSLYAHLHTITKLYSLH